MKRTSKLIIVALVGVAFFFTVAFAAGLWNRDDQDVYSGKWKFWKELEMQSGSTFDVNGTIDLAGATITATSKITGTHVVDVVRYIQLPLASFVIAGTPVTNATAPGIEVDDLIPGIVWADGEVTPALISFRVPSDYASGGAFKIYATESDSTTPNEVDFLVYENKDGSAVDAAATDQTPVALAGTTSTPDEITLTVATDFAALAAGDLITLAIWRDNTAVGTGDLEVKGASFYYTASQ